MKAAPSLCICKTFPRIGLPGTLLHLKCLIDALRVPSSHAMAISAISALAIRTAVSMLRGRYAGRQMCAGS